MQILLLKLLRKPTDQWKKEKFIHSSWEDLKCKYLYYDEEKYTKIHLVELLFSCTSPPSSVLLLFVI